MVCFRQQFRHFVLLHGKFIRCHIYHLLNSAKTKLQWSNREYDVEKAAKPDTPTWYLSHVVDNHLWTYGSPMNNFDTFFGGGRWRRWIKNNSVPVFRNVSNIFTCWCHCHNVKVLKMWYIYWFKDITVTVQVILLTSSAQFEINMCCQMYQRLVYLDPSM